MILADTSAWVEYDRATGSAVDGRVRHLIESEGPLAVTEPVAMEVLAGARDERREDDLRRLLLRFHQLPFDPVVDFEGAARIYRRCRAAGVTPRGLIDCMIATVAWRGGASLLTSDKDLCRIAEVVGIDMDDASPVDGALEEDLSGIDPEPLRRTVREDEQAAEARRGSRSG